MIGKLKGFVDSINDDMIILDVNNIGYDVYCTDFALSTLQLHQKLTLHIEMHIKENQITLYGFFNIIEKSCFKCLNLVQGISGKTALSILSKYTPTVIVENIKKQDSKSFCLVSGIGSKLAIRIITELLSNKQFIKICSNLEKQKQENELQYNQELHKKAESNTFQLIDEKAIINVSNDAVSAISNLGFNKHYIEKIVFKLIEESRQNGSKIILEDIIKNVLLRVSQ